MSGSTRPQDLGNMAIAMEEQDKILTERKAGHLNTNSRIDQLADMISGLTLQQNRLMAHLHTFKSDDPKSSSISQFFEVDRNLDELKLKLAVVHFGREGIAMAPGLYEVNDAEVSINENNALSHFLGGLRGEIQLSVRMFKPESLAQACSLARLQESTYQAMVDQASQALKLQGLFSTSVQT
ncbi:hypothetical protein CRG98_005432 [Punica granatum]|uniref:Uncharacterized protein n=1 Tax=Punica granatum TaxID=22663 RepID=A0A2I0L0E5_PUNGR|nr:hypothetical protein CRG98_005432 [Punica granatum]